MPPTRRHNNSTSDQPPPGPTHPGPWLWPLHIFAVVLEVLRSFLETAERTHIQVLASASSPVLGGELEALALMYEGLAAVEVRAHGCTS